MLLRALSKAQRSYALRGMIASMNGATVTPRAVLFTCVLLVMVPACAQRHRNPAPDPVSSKYWTPQLIRQLEAAEEADLSSARDPRISLVRKEDFFEQADKAERAIRELMYGYDVSQAELADALAVPPKNLSPEVKADLIRQLRDSIALNDRREQSMLNNYFSAADVDTTPYDAQKAFTAAVVKELTISDDVHWDTVQQALQAVAPDD
jgi:hypothetical protein